MITDDNVQTVHIVRIPFGEFLLQYLQNVSVDENTGYSWCVRLRENQILQNICSWLVRIVQFSMSILSMHIIPSIFVSILCLLSAPYVPYIKYWLNHWVLADIVSILTVHLAALSLLIQNRKWSFCFISEPRDDIV